MGASDVGAELWPRARAQLVEFFSLQDGAGLSLVAGFTWQGSGWNCAKPLPCSGSAEPCACPW
eukprot:8574095-Lingulodinium_polyedra.AAC.1